MALVANIDGYDIAQYIQAALDDFDPANAFQSPQFAGNSLTDGDLYISMTRSNREWSFPLLIIGTSNDNLNSTVRTINSHLKQGVTLEYREDGATNSTYFDVESAVLEPDYRYQRNRQGVGKFMLRVWSRPLGHTGTTRTVATGISSGGVFSYNVSSMLIGGDADAALRLTVDNASVPVHLVAWGHATDPAQVVTHAAGNPNGGLHQGGYGVGTFMVAGSNSVVPTVLAVHPTTQMFAPVRYASSGAMPSYLLGKTVRAFLSYSPRSHPSSTVSASYIATARMRLIHDAASVLEYGPVVGFRGMGDPAAGAVASGKYALLDMGTLSIPSCADASLQLMVRPLPVATMLAPSMIAHVDALYLMPPGGAAFYRYLDYGMAQTTADGVTSGLTALAPQSNSSANITLGVNLRGVMPRVSSPSGVGALHVLAKSISGDIGATKSIQIDAREQFQFFR